MSGKALTIINVICLILFVFMMVYIFGVSGEAEAKLQPLFEVLNPFKIGGWIMAIGFLFNCIWGKGKSGLVWGIVMGVCYVITGFLSLFGLIALTKNWDLLWYLHILVFILACIIAIIRKAKGAKTV